MNPHDVLAALRRAEAVIAAYQRAFRDKQADHIGRLEPDSAKRFLTYARDDLLAYRPQAERFSRERSRAAKPLVPRS